MKRILVGILTLMALVFMISCETSNNPVGPETGASDASLGKGKGGGASTAGGETAYTCTDHGSEAGLVGDCPSVMSFEYTLWAGKHNDAGTVKIWADGSDLFVEYNTNETADLKEAHVYVWTDETQIPSKRPAPGQAPYTAENINADSYTFVIEGMGACGETVYVSTHAALIADGSSGSEENAGETAYTGEPSCFDGQKGAWWGYATFSVDCYYEVSGTVYEDANNNGQMDAGEEVFAGIAMSATGGYSATTDESGNYSFFLPAGVDYLIESADPAGDFLANENAGGYNTGLLSDCLENVNFGFVPLYDINVDVDLSGVDGDCVEGMVVTINGMEIFPDANGNYILENQLPADNYEIVVSLLDADGAVLSSQSSSIFLTADTSVPFDMSYTCPSDPPSSDDNFPTWGQDISHVVLAFTAESAPNGDSDYYLIKIDEYPDAGNDDLDDDIDSYLAQLVSMGLLNSNYELIGSSIKGGRQVTSFYYYGSYNSNGETADAPPAGFPLTYTGGADNEGNQNLIDVTVDWSAFQ